MTSSTRGLAVGGTQTLSCMVRPRTRQYSKTTMSHCVILSSAKAVSTNARSGLLVALGEVAIQSLLKIRVSNNQRDGMVLTARPFV